MLDYDFARRLAGRQLITIAPQGYLRWQARSQVLAIVYIAGAVIGGAVLAFPLSEIWIGLGYQGDGGTVWLGMWAAQMAVCFVAVWIMVAVQFCGFLIRLMFGDQL